MTTKRFRLPALITLGVITILCTVAAFAVATGGNVEPHHLTAAAMPHDWLGSLGAMGAIPFAGKTKMFRVATEGATTDGRVIERSWIEQMAKNFNRTKYGARVWLEHFRGIFPDSAFKAYGDVLALESREVEGGKLGLFAQIDPLPELVKIVNDQKQKVYTSIEVNPKFADTGEAYMVGLAVTDSPASLGTEMLQFAQQHPDANPLKKRKLDPNNLFSEAVEVSIELESESDGKSIADRMKEIVAKTFGRQKVETDDRFADVEKAMEGVTAAVGEEVGKLTSALAKVTGEFNALQKKHDDLVAQVNKTESSDHSQRPPATGGAGQVLTDC